MIYVADGTYMPDEAPETAGDRNASFELIKDVSVLGGYAGYSGLPNACTRDVILYETILSGDLNGDDASGGDNSENSRHVVSAYWASHEADELCVLDGFTITGGNARPFNDGGGIYCFASSPRIASCRIAGNAARKGGGVFMASGVSPTLANCILTGNDADEGAAVFLGSQTPKILNCTIAANRGDGTAVYCGSGTLQLINSIVWGNHGGAIYESSGASMEIAHSLIDDAWPEASVWDADPRFVDEDGADDILLTWQDNDYHLAADSPAIDRADPAALPDWAVHDVELELRDLQCAPDIGAHESPYRQDCNTNGVCDDLDLATMPDCNANGIPDACDVSEGISRDCYLSNGIPDECETSWFEFDYDGDCDIDQTDFAKLQRCMNSPGEVTRPGCYVQDHDADDNVDADDVDLLSACASGPMVVPDCGESLLGGESLLAESYGDPLLPATEGLATAVSIHVVQNPYPGPYVDSRTESVGFDQSFVIWTRVDADGDMDGLQYRLRVNGGADDDAFRMTGYADGPLSVINPVFDGLGDLFSLYGPPGAWAPSDYGKFTPPVTLDALLDEVVFNASQFVEAAAFPETLIGVVIEPVNPLTAGDYVFSAGGGIASNGVAEWAATPLTGVTTGNQSFTLTIQAE